MKKNAKLRKKKIKRTETADENHQREELNAETESQETEEIRTESRETGNPLTEEMTEVTGMRGALSLLQEEMIQ